MLGFGTILFVMVPKVAHPSAFAFCSFGTILFVMVPKEHLPVRRKTSVFGLTWCQRINTSNVKNRNVWNESYERKKYD